MLNFTSRTRFSDHIDLFDEVRRNCEFFTVGKIPTKAPAKIVPISAPKYLSELRRYPDDIVGIICSPEVAEQCPDHLGCAVSSQPLHAAYTLHKKLAKLEGYFWTPFESIISPTAQIHPSAYVAPYNVIIGEGVVVQPNASVMERTSLGDGTIVGPNSTIGADAYEIVNINGTPELITQVGGVSVGEGVVFLASVTIARSSFPVMTRIGDYCSFDNQVHVAHDCVLGKNVKMTACSMLSGRVELGDNAYIGPNATISNGVTIGRNARISLGAVVASNIPDDAHVSGNFAMDHKAFLRAFRNLKSI